MKPSEVVAKVISLARAANKARAEELSVGDVPFISTLRPATAEEKRLQEFLQAQPPGVIYLLTAIMYFGRGDFDSKDEFLEYYADVSETFGNPKAAARQMMVKEPLPEYLEQGLQNLQKVGLDIDKLAA
jgi:hypothetical protein